MSRYSWASRGGLKPANHAERKVRDAYEAAHPHVRRSREAFESMAAKVSAFLDVPAKLPVRSYTEAEKAIIHEWDVLNNLKEHVRWRSLVHLFQTQQPVPVVRYVDVTHWMKEAL